MPIQPAKDLKAKLTKKRNLYNNLTTTLTARVLMSRNTDELLSSSIAPRDLFNTFNISGLQFPGQTCSGWAELGTGVTASLSFDFGDLLMPGFLSIKASVSGKGERTSHGLIAIQRQPEYVFTSQSAIAEQITSTPICFMVLSGQAHTYGVKVAAMVSIGKSFGATKAINNPTELGPEELALSLEATAKGEASASAEYKYRYMLIDDSQPNWYHSTQDSTLEDRFYQLIQPGSKDDIRMQTYLWLTKMWPPRLFSFTRINPSTHKEIQGSTYYKTKNLLKALKEAPKHIGELSLTPNQQQQCNLKVKEYMAMLNKLKEFKEDKASAAFLDTSKSPVASKPYCFLSLWGQEGGAGVSAAATFNISASAGGVNALASAGVSGKIGCTVYRFQTAVHRAKKPAIPLIMTQDTRIEYRQVTYEAKAEGQLKLPGLKRKSDASKGGTLYNLMRYSAAVVFWEYGTTSQYIQGSGMSFGLSVTRDRLINLAHIWRSNTPLSNEATSFVKLVTSQLKIKEADLKTFLLQSWLTQDKKLDLDLYPDAWLIESNWATPASYPAKALAKEDRTYILDKEVWETMKKDQENKFTLQAIRLRYRVADMKDDSFTRFKLGFSVGAGAGISVQAVSRAGIMGIVDMDTYWVNNPKNTSKYTYDDPGSTYYNYGVPPAILLYQ